MNIFTRAKWPIFALLLVVNIRIITAAARKEEHNNHNPTTRHTKKYTPVDEKTIIASTKQLGANTIRVREICKQAGLNPDYGLGDINTLVRYTHYSPFMQINLLQEAGQRAAYEKFWNEAHVGYTIQQLNEFKWNATDIARMVARAGGYNAVKEYRERLTARVNNLHQIQRERELSDARTANFISKWQSFGNACLKGLENLKDHQDTLKETFGTMGLYTFYFFTGCTLIYFTSKYGLPYIMSMIFVKKPQIVKKMRLSWRLWRSKKVESAIKELHYSDNMMEWLEPSIVNDSQRIIANCEQKGCFKFTTVLLKGPPGTGKTALAEAYAAAADFDYIHVGGSAWSQLAEAEALKDFKSTLKLAQKNKRPVLFFIDEIDVVFPKRAKTTGVPRKLTSSFLEDIDKAYNSNIKFIFATNLPQELSPAIRSRCGEEIDVIAPTEAKCKEIYTTYMHKYCEKHRLNYQEADLKLYGLTGRDIELVCLQLAENTKLNGGTTITSKDAERLFKAKLGVQLKKQAGERTNVADSSTQTNVTDSSLLIVGGIIILLLLILTLLIWFRKRKDNPSF